MRTDKLSAKKTLKSSTMDMDNQTERNSARDFDLRILDETLDTLANLITAVGDMEDECARTEIAGRLNDAMDEAEAHWERMAGNAAGE